MFVQCDIHQVKIGQKKQLDGLVYVQSRLVIQNTCATNDPFSPTVCNVPYFFPACSLFPNFCLIFPDCFIYYPDKADF